MSITKISSSPDETKVTIEIDNGHLEALKKITSDYEIADIEKTLGFLLAVVSKTDGKPIKIGADTFVPGQAIKAKKEDATVDVSDTPEQ
jgi:hypothetical protein